MASPFDSGPPPAGHSQGDGDNHRASTDSAASLPTPVTPIHALAKRAEVLLHQVLLPLGRHLRHALLSTDAVAVATDAETRRQSASDQLYGLDLRAEALILSQLQQLWPAGLPLRLVMEGLDPDDFPPSSATQSTEPTEPAKPNPKPSPTTEAWTLLLDPVDGTRGRMHGLRSAWFIAALAPDLGEQTRLHHSLAAVLLELPLPGETCAWEWWGSRASNQTQGQHASLTPNPAADSCHGSADVPVRFNPIQSESLPINPPSYPSNSTLSPTPSQADTFRHGFVASADYFPEGRLELAQLLHGLWSELEGQPGEVTTPVFNDTTLATGAHFHHLLRGAIRASLDLRPLLLPQNPSLCAHPYDLGAALLLELAGCPLTIPHGQPCDIPWDCTSAVAYLASANPTLHQRLLQALIPRLPLV